MPGLSPPRGSRRAASDLVFRLIHLKPVGEGDASSTVLDDDGVWFGGPDKWLGVLIAMLNPIGDGRFEVGYAGEGTAADALARDLGKQPLDEVEPGRGCRREVQGEARVALEPALNRRCLVGGIVVEDQVQGGVLRYLPVGRLEERHELLGTMARQAFANDLTVRDIERGKQGGGSVALVVMGHGAGAPLLQGQARLGR